MFLLWLLYDRTMFADMNDGSLPKQRNTTTSL